MRLVKIPNTTYEDFEDIRDAIYNTVPFAIFHCGYSKKLLLSIFNFWDSDYIPEQLKKYIAQPPLSRENVEKINKDLVEVLKRLKLWA